MRFSFLIAGSALAGLAAAAPVSVPRMPIASFEQIPKPLPLPYDEGANADQAVAAAKARARRRTGSC